MNSSRFRAPSRLPNHGWTLIELLAVIAIVLVLFTISIGITGEFSKRAKDTQCVANLRQLGSSFLYYTQDYHRGVIRSQISGGNLETGWTRLIVNKGYLPSQTPWKILCCPIGNMPQTAKTSMERYNPRSPSLAAGDSWRWYTYGLNACAIPNVATVTNTEEEVSGLKCRVFQMSLSNVPKAAEHVLLADSSSGTPDNYQRQSMERDNKGGPCLRHGPKSARYANAVFLDGHVEPLTRERIIALGNGFRTPVQYIFETE